MLEKIVTVQNEINRRDFIYLINVISSISYLF